MVLRAQLGVASVIRKARISRMKASMAEHRQPMDV